MATQASITINSTIMDEFGGLSRTMTLTKAGTTNDIEETTGFSRRKLASTSATDLIRMATELVDTTATTTAAKVYIKNIGHGGVIDKSTYVTISIGDTAGTPQEIGRLYGGDWMLFPVTAADDKDIVATPETDNAVVLEYIMFFE
tara:strand:- start:270 stop:704 length:435 start_codon:yes stop_codon:yes gene_type:complete